MPTQKIFKKRVRARMTKTGESYTAARRQLLHKADAIAGPEPVEPAPAVEPAVPPEFLTSDDAMRRATGKGHAEWFALLDGWGATEHKHPEIARWLKETQGTPSWWTQTITVDYERARGMRGRHEMGDGYSISVTRTINVDPERVLASFTSEPVRKRWLGDASLHQRPTRAALTARFDWADPASRVVVTVTPKGTDSTLLSVSHERLPDADSAERLKHEWRARLDALKAMLTRP